MSNFDNFTQNTILTNPDLPQDALSSKQFNTLVEILSEGEIEGSATASRNGITNQSSTEYKNSFLKDIFLNNVPVLNAGASVTSPQDSDFNFQDVNFDFRLGTNGQTKINGVRQIEREIAKNLPVTNSNPAEHSINDSSIETVRVTLQFPVLQLIEDNGNIVGASVQIQIKSIQANNTETVHINDTVTGRTTNVYNRDYEFDLPSGANFPVVIRVARITADSTETTLQDSFRFQTVTELIKETPTYPNTAISALRFSSEQFPRIPNRIFRLRGIKVQIPHNATVDPANGRLTYSGTFDGSFKSGLHWTTDPAWILYDLLRNDRYGCQLAADDIDKFTFKTVSEHCGELVSDGNGGLEPRFSTNINITTQKEAYSVIKDLCSIMRAVSYFAGDTIELANDQQSEPVYIFTDANVTEEGFVYFGTSRKTRHTVFNISYFDMETKEIDYETVSADAATIAKYGTSVKTVKGIGTTSRGQAQRLGKWFLFNEQNAGETVSFSTTADAGLLIKPNDIIAISDSVKAGKRRGGRLALDSTPTTTQIVLDDSANTDIPILGANPTISVILPDGHLSTKTISNINGKTITVDSAFTNAAGQQVAPNVNTVYILETPTFVTQQYRVNSVIENSNMTYSITATLHNSNKYAFIEDGELLPNRSISTLTELKQPPAEIEFQEKLVAVNNKAVSKLFVNWEPVNGAVSYQLQYRYKNGNFININTTASDYLIENADVGKYEFRIFSVNALGQPSSAPKEAEHTNVGKTDNPQPVQNLRIEPVDGQQVRLKWNKSTEVDVLHGGLVFIRHSPQVSGVATFSQAQNLIEAIPGNSTEALVPALVGRYILRYQDDGGRFSSSDSSVLVSMPNSLTELTIKQQRENPSFSGNKTNLTVASSKLKLSNSLNNQTGTYEFANILDIGATYSLGLERVISSLGVYTTDLIDSRTALVDTWDSWDGAVANSVNADLTVAVSEDNTTYTDFQDLTKGTFKGRYFKFKSNITADDPAQNVEVSILGFNAFFAMRTETSAENAGATNGVISSGTSSSGKNISFTNNFFIGTSSLGGTTAFTPSINVVPQNMGTGEFFTISNVTASGFNIIFKNSSNTVINRNFTFSATGFGKST